MRNKVCIQIDNRFCYSKGTMGKIIAVTNQKGGVGKTTTTINLAAYLAHEGNRVLLIDLDPQGNSTSGIGVDRNALRRSLYDVLINEINPQESIFRTKYQNLHIIPSATVLAAAEVELVSHFAREHKLKNALAKLSNDYDYIFLDSPPSLGLLTVNGLTASDKILIPVQAEYFALEGLSQLLHTVQRIKTSLNPNIDLLGVLLTMYDKRTILSRQVEQEVKKHFPGKVFDTIIPRNIRLAEAPSFGKSIFKYDKLGKGANAYKSLAKEVHIKCQ